MQCAFERMSKLRKINIADRTIILKSQSKDASLSFKEKIEIARLLECASVDVIEFPKIENEKIDTLLLKTICAFLKNSIMSVEAGVTVEDVRKTYNSIKFASHPRLSVVLPVSPVQMEYQCHKKANKMLELIEELVSESASLCETEFIATDATRAEKEFLYSAISTAINSGAKIITICDSEGSFLPNEFTNFIKDIKENVKDIEKVQIGIMCNDENGCSAASTMLSILDGASEVKTSSTAGDIPSIITISNIIRNSGDKLDIKADLNYTKFTRIISQVAKIADSKQILKTNEVSNLPYSEFCLTINDSQIVVADAVKKLGYDLSDDDMAKVYEAFKNLADKKPVSNKELDAIVATNALQVTPTYNIVNYVINTGNIINSSAQITLDKNGESKTAIAIGDGPIDAAFKAIEQILGHHYELDDFQIQAITEGREAMGSALIKLRSKGKLYSGKGISTDIIGSSIRAYINAINKITFEEN